MRQRLSYLATVTINTVCLENEMWGFQLWNMVVAESCCVAQCQWNKDQLLQISRYSRWENKWIRQHNLWNRLPDAQTSTLWKSGGLCLNCTVTILKYKFDQEEWPNIQPELWHIEGVRICQSTSIQYWLKD